MSEEQHGIRQVNIDQGSVVVVCTCGWNSLPAASETEAVGQHSVHFSAVVAPVVAPVEGV